MKHHQHHETHHEHHRGWKGHIMENKGLVVAIVVVFGLVIAGGYFIFFNGSKADSVNVQCASLCETGQRTAFCDFNIVVNKNLNSTCGELSTKADYSQYNVDVCPTISCVKTPEELDKTCVTGGNSEWATPVNNLCPEKTGLYSAKRKPSDTAPVEGQICCFYYS